jgi:electron transfer flavoprotein alpha subunit
MQTVLFLAHTESDGNLGKAALEALSAAMAVAEKSGAGLVAGLFGADVQGAADKIAACGAVRFLGVSGEGFAQARYASDAAAVEALCRAAGAEIVIGGGTSRINRVLPGAAHRLGGCGELHATAIEADGDGVAVTRWYYRQRMRAVLRREQRPWLIALDSGVCEAWQGDAGTAQVENIAVELGDACMRTSVVGQQSPQSGAQTIRPDAELLFVAGAGWMKKQSDGQTHVSEAEALILDALKKTQASLGGSKSVVDISGEGGDVLSFMTHLNQVGQTGAVPRHPKGLATCCHGEEPHVVGWRFVNERRAVNLDPNCGWSHGKADVLYVADAFEVMRKVNALLGE